MGRMRNYDQKFGVLLRKVKLYLHITIILNS